MNKDPHTHTYTHTHTQAYYHMI